jgi:L-ribulose-5-phosphate 4-epimerase
LETSPLDKVFDLTGGTGCNRLITDGEVTDMAGLHDERKTQVLECSRWLSENGFFGTLRGTGGNISVRVPGEDLLVVTPSTRRYDTMTPEDICVVDFDLKVVEGKLPPSVETGMHAAIYANRPDVGSVVHTHQFYASVFCVMNRPIPALFDELTYSMGETVEVIPYALSGSKELVENVAAKMSSLCDCYLIQNHGALCLGRDLQMAWMNVEFLEKSAKVYYHALCAGGAVSTLPADVVSMMTTLRRDAQAKVAAVNKPK